MPRIIFPPEAKKLSDEYRPYMDFTKLPPCFKPGTPDYIKKKKLSGIKLWIRSLKEWTISFTGKVHSKTFISESA